MLMRWFVSSVSGKNKRIHTHTYTHTHTHTYLFGPFQPCMYPYLIHHWTCLFICMPICDLLLNGGSLTNMDVHGYTAIFLILSMVEGAYKRAHAHTHTHTCSDLSTVDYPYLSPSLDMSFYMHAYMRSATKWRVSDNRGRPRLYSNIF